MTAMRDVILKDKLNLKGEQHITKITGFHLDDVLWGHSIHPNIVPYVEDIIGFDMKAIHTMVIHKPPEIGASGRHPFHQDLYYFPIRPAHAVVCAWTAMQKIDRQNGCLSVIPGSHQGVLLAHGYPDFLVNKAYHGVLNFSPPNNRVHLEMDEGDTVLFHPLLLHGSGMNRTNGFRKAISTHYASSSICHYIDVKGTIQDEVSKEVDELVQKYVKKRVQGSTNLKLSYQDLWRIKSRHIKGKED